MEDKDMYQKFGEFAFGNDFRKLVGAHKFAERWNEKHGNEYKIDMSNSIHDDMRIMLQIWRDSIKP